MKKRILVVDDEPNIVELIRLILCELYQIDVAFNGKEALEKVKKNLYDLILLDIMMPEMDGYEVKKRIDEMNLNIPVIFLTAKGEWDDKMKALKFGGSDDYITKPFEIDDLLDRVSAVFHEKS